VLRRNCNDRSGSFTTEVAQLKCPHLPAADIEGSARYNGPRGPIVGSKAETSRTNREPKLGGRLRPPFLLTRGRAGACLGAASRRRAFAHDAQGPVRVGPHRHRGRGTSAGRAGVLRMRRLAPRRRRRRQGDRQHGEVRGVSGRRAWASGPYGARRRAISAAASTPAGASAWAACYDCSEQSYGCLYDRLRAPRRGGLRRET
jgi:hypothetical protein